jgi:glycosyltransferase involved in cell wall biosynthesis
METTNKKEANRIKVAILADPLDNQQAGIHVYTCEFISAIQTFSRVIELHVLRNGNNPQVNTANTIKIPNIGLPGSRIFRYFFQLPAAIRKLKPEIVIEPAHFGPFNLPKKIKRVTVIHDLTPVLYPKWHNFHHSLLQKIFLPSILRRARLIIVNSKSTLNDLISYYPSAKNKAIMIYPSLNPFFETLHPTVSQKKEPFFLTTGTIEPRKNHITLLKAYTIFREQNPFKHKLIICGSTGWKSNAFYEALENHPFKTDIILKGYVDLTELKLLYASCTAFIYPSFYEGFGYPVAEAMSCGAPCIISNTSSLPEVGGDAALYFAPDDPAQLSELMKNTASDQPLCNTLSTAGFRQVSTFNRELFARELEDCLIKLK